MAQRKIEPHRIEELLQDAYSVKIALGKAKSQEEFDDLTNLLNELKDHISRVADRVGFDVPELEDL